MHDFDDSTLWRLSAFEHARETGAGEFGAARATLLPTTLLADLRRLQSDPASDDVLEVVAACLRHREATLLYLALGEVVWPVTLFPHEQLYHSPRAVSALAGGGALSRLALIGAERPGVRPPGHPAHDRVAAFDKYAPLAPLLWALALQGPRATLLSEIGGRAAYRLVPARAAELPPAPGALGPAMQRLRQQTASLREIAGWPGMSLERASRLLNALYLAGCLMATRGHPAARPEPAVWRQWLGRRR